jgi:hypothetical protein
VSPEIEEIIYLALENGIISRGKACAALQFTRCCEIDRCELDDWIATYEREHGIGDNKP